MFRGYALLASPRKLVIISAVLLLAIYYSYMNDKKYFIIYTFIVLLSGFLTFSSTYVVVVICMIFLFLVIAKNKMRVVKGLLKLGALAFIIIALFIYIYDLGELIIGTVFSELNWIQGISRSIRD